MHPSAHVSLLEVLGPEHLLFTSVILTLYSLFVSLFPLGPQGLRGKVTSDFSCIHDSTKAEEEGITKH